MGEIIAGSAAEESELKSGDVIKKIDGQALTPGWISLLDEPLEKGNRIVFEVDRDGEALEIEIEPRKIEK